MMKSYLNYWVEKIIKLWEDGTPVMEAIDLVKQEKSRNESLTKEERLKKAEELIRENHLFLTKKDIAELLVLELGYKQPSAYALLRRSGYFPIGRKVSKEQENEVEFNKLGISLREYLDKEEIKEQEQYKKSQVELELNRPKIFI